MMNGTLNKEEFKSYRGVVGQQTWLSEMTRPDLSYDTLDLASYNNEATVRNLKMISKIVGLSGVHALPLGCRQKRRWPL